MSVTSRAEQEPDDQLFREFGAGGAAGDRALEALVLRHRGLVNSIAARYAGGAVDREELRQIGNVGLVLAIRRFDPDRGTDFPAFARPTIHGEICRHFRDKRRWVRIPRRIQEMKQALRGATEELTHLLGRAPTPEELALRLGADLDAVTEALGVHDNFAVACLDSPVGPGPGAPALADTLGVDDRCIETFIDCNALRPLIAALTPRERAILEMRFVRDCTQAEIGRALGISQMHVSRLLTAILTRLRDQMSMFAAA